MKKRFVFPWLIGAAAAALFLAAVFYLGCPALNVHNPGLWWLLDGGLLVFVLVAQLVKANSDYRQQAYRQVLGKKKNRKKKKENAVVELRFSGWGFLLPGVLAAVILLITAAGGRLFHASDYARILSVKEADFTGDLAESVGTDSIALMDTASAKMLGDREIGALSDVVSQFDVSDDYTQIDRGGRPLKVAALEYAGFFKWLNNKEEGVRGYVTVDPVSMSASFHRAEGMRYVPSACFSQDARRYLRMKYPTKMMDNLHFEIDEEGHPYYVASVLQKTVALFGGKTVEGCVTLDPVTGETALYGLADVPRWIDVVYHGDLICTQYNWFGSLRNGFLNSLFAKKGCQRVTTYRAAEDEDSGDRPVSDYGYVAKDGDTVNIDFVGYVDDEPFDGGDSQGAGYDLVLGSGSFIDDFEDQICGHSPGDAFDVEVTFPEDYGNEDLAGKDAKFETTLNYIVENVDTSTYLKEIYDDIRNYMLYDSEKAYSMLNSKQFKNYDDFKEFIESNYTSIFIMTLRSYNYNKQDNIEVYCCKDYYKNIELIIYANGYNDIKFEINKI